tara:strand:+ start:2075 stop:2365 length:291 start_codon:yes stop_codon:yes gene_type:complete
MQPEVETDTNIVKNKPPAAGKGRPKGAKNKNSKLLKDAILEAAELAGGKRGMVAYLEIQAEKNPTAFMALMGKVLPLQVTGSGAQGEHEFVIKWKS